ncbi:aspartate-semialdehyde dehydrogenase [Listeria innocua]|nr:aspartate-semialdehyde dehydrogenase [Listeria monocytogenes]EFR92498.1 putative aspartate-semialdehyde dehydrogenase [Listeria innocua FSL J1-023]EKD7142823.1 aspartate-semialdehyde dehydrogenase [Listeria innocua]EAE3511139.1 aspartate-semialdehyde dehydrogenase [Listeria monocytogenes]EAE7674598.1 aspartate-semialdehyde dehydrogenase [Listeria monocytogenes]
MLTCLVFDKLLNQKDIISITGGSFTSHIWDWQPFEIKTRSSSVQTDDFITVLDGKEPVFSGVVKQSQESSGVFTYSGFDLRLILDRVQMNYLLKRSLVSSAVYTGGSFAILKNTIQLAFPAANIIAQVDEDRTTFSLSPRMQTAFAFHRSNCVSNDITYQLFIVSNRRLLLKGKYLRDKRREVVLLTDITHTQGEVIRNTKEAYNQILGLGSGEDNNRDYHFIDNKASTDYASCFVYDIRENITHAELVQRTVAKQKELQFEYTVKFYTLKNNVAQLGQEYDVGDYVSFRMQDGTLVDDLVSAYTINIDKGILSPRYELETGIKKGSLTAKLKDLKEGGYK